MTTAPVLLLSAALRIVHFSGGTATITTQNGGVEHVVMKDAKGDLVAESDCDSQSGTYDHIVSFGQAVIIAAKNDDRTAMMTLVQYPIRINVKAKPLFIKDAATLQIRYQAVFTPAVLGQLRQVDPHDVFCREGMSMLGGGIVWATADKSGALKIAVVNE